MQPWVVLEKAVGQTPLEVAEDYRTLHPELAEVKMAYAGRLDPMASGKLLVLLGDECKRQTDYHGLDKAYEIEVLLDVSSDSGDVLGLVHAHEPHDQTEKNIRKVTTSFRGPFTPPYPIFSSKPVDGKPLHTWAMEDRLDEIEIPLQDGLIYDISDISQHTISAADLYELALKKVNSIPDVTDERKAIGKNFRREPIRTAWQTLLDENSDRTFSIIQLTCTCSSGTYMRSLAEEIGTALDTHALALSIHRTHIGTYQPLPFGSGFWKRSF